MTATPLLEAVGVVREYRSPRQSLRTPGRPVRALDGVSLQVHEGEAFGIVGESGSGKSTLSRILMALDQPTAGIATYAGQRISGVPERRLGFLRRDVQMVLQDPMSSLNPRMRVADIIAEPMRALRLPGDHRARVAELMHAVGLPEEAVSRYPHQFSGGQRQRIAIARALAAGPKVIVGDEPVSALDVSVRAQILNLLTDLAEQFRLTLVLVSHDLSVVRYLCDRVAVMNQGRIVETGDTASIYSDPQHPYTQRLLSAVPTLRGDLLDRFNRSST
ncbi:ATP-binding cassette domain-containing protein [Micromonospora profundi]|uniref:ATP-binding cassette domain-containing protein n=1 Tax=Micromonospora TaxID=1873 RepID=UPI0006B0241E|nr:MULTISPECIES: ATP-binding cassette domain-containing protein [Micromonospora]KOX10945.1 diguanylate cyclase [Micromonospora sp. NRRL B-16802]NJC10384.1 peptide/nickel transport system ATP-binding protein [Micromonospora profundi]